MDTVEILRLVCCSLLGSSDEKGLPDDKGKCRRGGESNERITLCGGWSI